MTTPMTPLNATTHGKPSCGQAVVRTPAPAPAAFSKSTLSPAPITPAKAKFSAPITPANTRPLTSTTPARAKPPASATPARAKPPASATPARAKPPASATPARAKPSAPATPVPINGPTRKVAREELIDQLSKKHFARIQKLHLENFDESSVREAKWPIPQNGIARGYLPSGRPYLVLYYEKNGAPSPSSEVQELIFFDKYTNRTPFGERPPPTAVNGTLPREPVLENKVQWTVLRREPNKSTEILLSTSLYYVRAMIENKSSDETGHRKLIVTAQ